MARLLGWTGFIPAALLLACSGAFAAPEAAAPASRSIGVAGATCNTARKAVDSDRGRIEALMLTLSAEDEKPETPARFRRMCALDKEISTSAGRLARTIRTAPDGCLASDDRAVASEMKRLSTPIPECKGAGTKQASAKTPVSPVKRSAKAPAGPKAAATSPIPVILAPSGMMSELY
jgi:hypothetical protein